MNQATSMVFAAIFAAIEFVLIYINYWLNGINIKIKLPNWINIIHYVLINTTFYLRYWFRALKWFCIVLAVYRELSIFNILPYDFFFMNI